MIKLATTKSRYAVSHTYSEGTFRKDVVSGHWTTYQVQPMSLAMAREVVEHELTKGGCGKFEIIDLDIESGLIAIVREIREAKTAEAGYDSWGIERRRGADGDAIRQEIRIAIAQAKQAALMEYIVNA